MTIKAQTMLQSLLTILIAAFLWLFWHYWGESFFLQVKPFAKGFNVVNKQEDLQSYNPFLTKEGNVVFVYSNTDGRFRKSRLYDPKKRGFSEIDLSTTPLYINQMKGTVSLGKYSFINLENVDLCPLIFFSQHKFSEYCRRPYSRILLTPNRVLLNVSPEGISLIKPNGTSEIVWAFPEPMIYSSILLNDDKLLIYGSSYTYEFSDFKISKIIDLKNMKIKDIPLPKYNKGFPVNLLLLKNGKVFILAETSLNPEYLDLKANKYYPAGRLTQKKSYPTVTLIQGQKILIAGGQVTDTASPIAELLDPARQWSSTLYYSHTPRYESRAVKLLDGNVLIVGGRLDEFPKDIVIVEVFVP